MKRLAAILTCLALAGCAGAASQTQAAEPAIEVTLAPGETAPVKSAGMKVRFVAVTEDSRCPRDTTCIWAGEVKVQIEIVRLTRVNSVEIPAGGNTVAGDYRVSVVRVEPQPTSTAPIAPQDYRATFKIEKVG